MVDKDGLCIDYWLAYNVCEADPSARLPTVLFAVKSHIIYLFTLFCGVQIGEDIKFYCLYFVRYTILNRKQTNILNIKGHHGPGHLTDCSTCSSQHQ